MCDSFVADLAVTSSVSLLHEQQQPTATGVCQDFSALGHISSIWNSPRNDLWSKRLRVMGFKKGIKK